MQMGGNVGEVNIVQPRIIILQQFCDIKSWFFSKIFGRLVRGVRAIEQQLSFEHDSRLGFLTFCPTNLGTTIRASVLIRIPQLLSKKSILDEISKKYNLQVT